MPKLRQPLESKIVTWEYNHFIERGVFMKKSVIILWAIAGFALISSVSLFSEGSAAAGVFGLIVAAGLGFFGWRKYKKPAATPQQASPKATEEAAPSPASDYEFIKFKVAGVTFKNGANHRQAILRKIKFRDRPFDKGDIELGLSRYEYEGNPAFAITANDQQIGNVPAEYTKYLNDNFSRILGFSHIDVYGGGEGKSFGAEVILKLKK